MSSNENDRERRVGQAPIPDDIHANLTELQHLTLARMEGFGWTIKFIRRPLFQDPVVVMVDPTGENFAILTEDGNLDRSTYLQVR